MILYCHIKIRRILALESDIWLSIAFQNLTVSNRSNRNACTARKELRTDTVSPWATLHITSHHIASYFTPIFF